MRQELRTSRGAFPCMTKSATVTTIGNVQTVIHNGVSTIEDPMQFWIGLLLGLIAIPYALFIRGLWRGAVGYPPDNYVERWLDS